VTLDIPLLSCQKEFRQSAYLRVLLSLETSLNNNVQKVQQDNILLSSLLHFSQVEGLFIPDCEVMLLLLCLSNQEDIISI
jgi:hypothetical protein